MTTSVKALREMARSFVLSAVGAFTRPPKTSFLRPLFFHDVEQSEVENFCAVLRRLKSVGKFIDTRTCVSMLEGQTPIKGAHFHLSFDDGNRSLITNVAPVLRQLEIPAILFVPTARIGVCNLSDWGETVTWDELKTLQLWGFEIGAHTRTHPRLATVLSESALESEILGSKQDIEERLGSECHYLSWPFGNQSDLNSLCRATALKAGFRACFGAARGQIVPGRTDASWIPRHHLEAGWPWSHVKSFVLGFGEE